MEARAGRLLLALAFILCPPATLAALVLPPHITSHMVLQRAPQHASIHGAADAGAVISLSIDGGLPQLTTASQTSEFVFELEPQPAGGPHRLVLLNHKTQEAVTLGDVMFGDVFLCSGQSNSICPHVCC